jgi:epoxyqueuosine reductase
LVDVGALATHPNGRNGPDGEVQAWVDVLDLLDADDETLLDRYGRWYLADRDPTWWRRNALVVLGNTGDPGDERTRTTLERYGAHPSEVLREHAVWAAERLGLEPVPTNPSTA